MKLLQDIPIIRADLDHLRTQDDIFAPYNINLSDLPWDMFESGFEGLTRTLQSQQISVTVADILWYRLKDLAAARTGAAEVTPDFFLTLDVPTLRNTGFTRQKTSYMQGLCASIQEGTFCPKSWNNLSDGQIIKKITALKGFGLWSAHTFMLFSLARPNILPARDLVVDYALQALFKLEKRPDYDEVLKLTKRWDGRLTAATLLLWHLQVEKKI